MRAVESGRPKPFSGGKAAGGHVTSEPQRIQDVIYCVLLENMRSARLAPGMRLRESDLARQFGVSRVPVRAALKRLEDESRLTFNGRQGYAVPGDPGRLPVDIPAPDLAIPGKARDELEARNWRQRLFEEAQTAIASAMVFGRFGINEKAMAGHYGVSRSVAHEIITRMERVGLVSQQANGRWQVGPMTETDVHDHYAMRRILEPIALREAAGKLLAGKLAAVRLDDQIGALRQFRADPGRVGTRELLLIERWLHQDIVLACDNRVLADSIKRSQLPLISTHISFTATRSMASVLSTIDQHLQVLEALRRGDVTAAVTALAGHLEQAAGAAGAQIKRISPADIPITLPFLTRLEQADTPPQGG